MGKKPALVRALLAGGLAAATATAGLVVGVAGPALADPTAKYVAVGSDTTQDVMNGVTQDLNGSLGSWDAVDPLTGANGPTVLINPKPGCVFTRPNGSSAGVAALRISLNQSSTASFTGTKPGAGCVDVARSSGGPANNVVDPTNGQLIYIPFALDALTMATGPATAVTGTDPAVATAITHADEFTVTQLQNLYKCQPQTVGGVTYDPNNPPAAGNQPIDLYVPQPSSGTRNFWLGTVVGLADTTNLNGCTHDHIVGSGTPGTLVEEHDGTVFATDPLAFGPFSIAQYLSQSRNATTHVRDRRHNVVLHNIVVGGAQVSPFNGTNLNASFPITREVYNVMKYDLVVSVTGDPVQPDANLVSWFVGSTTAFLCRDGASILRYGFARLDGVSSAHHCGDIDTAALRAFTTL